jgi:hypothetical protein
VRIDRLLLLAGIGLAFAAPAGADHHEDATPAAAGELARSAFATAVEDREPVDDLSSLTNDHSQVLFFTELTGLEGQTVSHRWERDGQVMADVSFDVRGPRWRVWSTKKLEPSWTGSWQVSVIDGAGRVIGSKQLSYVPVAAAPAAPASPAADAQAGALE